MKGAAPRALPYASIAQVHSLITEISKSPTPEGFTIGVGVEYVPLHKVASVPPSATAFRRTLAASNVMIVITWDNDSKDSVGKAREYADAIIDILVGDQVDKEGYANYCHGASVLSIALVAGKMMSPRTFRCGRGGSGCSGG